MTRGIRSLLVGRDWRREIETFIHFSPWKFEIADVPETPVVEWGTLAWARLALAILGELDTLSGALEECAAVSGADLSGGAPSWPPLHIWAVQEVKHLREDYDEAIS